MAKKVIRTIQRSCQLREDQLSFLDRKINKTIPERASRSAMIQALIDAEMQHPKILA